MKNLKTEVLAGITTFLTMSYIIVVNPSILATEGTGMSFSGVLTATILISFLSTILMGLFAKLPFALAPGMGINAFFTFTLILGEKIPWQEALGMVFWSGVFFILISVTPLREKIARSIPHHLRLALAAGIGLFLTLIGFKNAMFVEGSPATLLKNAPFSLELLLAITGFATSLFFLKRKNPASFLIGILSTTVLAFLFQKIELPSHFVSAPDFQSVFLKLDIWGALKWAALPSILTLVATDLFDSLSTFIGVSESAGLLDTKGNPKRMREALIVDALATFFSSFFGTSAATTFVESSAGTEAGGRTGLTAITTAFCFLPFLFLSPLIGVIPPYATAPILVIVGALMFKNIKKIDFSSLENALPAFLTIAIIPFTFSITQGILWGFLAHNSCYLIFGKRKDLDPFILGLGVASAALLWIQG